MAGPTRRNTRAAIGLPEQRASITPVSELRRVIDDAAAEETEDEEAPQEQRPRRRSECRFGERPCPWVSCEHHLALEVTASGGLRETYPGRELDELPETCALDVAEAGETSHEEIGRALNVTRQRVQQIEIDALRVLRTQGIDLADLIGIDAATVVFRCPRAPSDDD